MGSNTALLVIDVQNGMFDEADPVYEGRVLLEKIHVAITKARAAGLPVVYVRHDSGPSGPLARGTAGWQIHPAISPLAGDIIVDKKTPDSFHETTLTGELGALATTRLILTGIQTEVCVDTTCRRAASLGYDVVLVRDAHSTWNSRALSARQIIDHHNDTLIWFADVKNLADVVF